MQRDTHHALITDAEAEAILQQLESGKVKTYRTRAKHLLTGILTDNDGKAYHGNGEYYRVENRAVKASRIDGAVLHQLVADLQSDAFTKALVASARKSAVNSTDADDLGKALKEIRAIDTSIDKLSNLLSETTATAALLRKIESLEQDRSEIQERLAAAEVSVMQSRALNTIEEKDVKSILNGIAERIDEEDRDDLKEILRSLIDRIEFDCSSSDCCIYYKIPVQTGEFVASPTILELAY